MRYLREQLSREVHPADVSFIESMASADVHNDHFNEQVPRQHDSTDQPTDFSSVGDDEESPSLSTQIMKKNADEKAVAQELTGNLEEEEEEEAECAMMAYFFSEAEHVVSQRKPPTTD